MKSNLQSRNKCQNYYLKTVHLNVNTGCNGTLHKRSKFVRVIFIQYKKRFHDVVVKPFKNHHQLFFDNVYNTLIKRFIKTKPNWNQYETFWKRYVKLSKLGDGRDGAILWFLNWVSNLKIFEVICNPNFVLQVRIAIVLQKIPWKSHVFTNFYVKIIFLPIFYTQNGHFSIFMG